MSKVFVEELKSGQSVDSIFLVRDKTLAVTKDGRPYIRVALMDRTGKVEARMWDRSGEEKSVERTFECFRQNDFVRVTGRVGNINGVHRGIHGRCRTQFVGVYPASVMAARTRSRASSGSSAPNTTAPTRTTFNVIPGTFCSASLTVMTQC